MEELSEDQIEEFKEAFSLFDPDNTGEIQTKELGTVLRSLGIYLSEKEKAEYIEEFDPDQTEVISFNSFLKILVKKLSGNKAEDELYEAFNLFTTDNKKEIKIDNFKRDFKEYLPYIPASEVDELCEYIKQETGNTISIDEAVQKLYTKVKNANSE